MGAGSVVGKSSALSAELRGLGAKTPDLPVYSGVGAHQQAVRRSVTECPVLCGCVQFQIKQCRFLLHADRTTRVSQTSLLSYLVAVGRGPEPETSPRGRALSQTPIPSSCQASGCWLSDMTRGYKRRLPFPSELVLGITARAIVQMIDNSTNSGAIALAQEISSTQNAEIDEMTELMRVLHGA